MTSQPVPTHTYGPGQATFPRGVILLTAIGLIASWAAFIVVTENAGADAVVDFERPAPLMFHLFHGVALLSVMLAGAFAVFGGRLRLIGAGGRIALLVLFAGAIAWALASYSKAQLLSAAVFGATGPFVWMTLVFVLAGTDRRVWRTIDPLIRYLAYATSLFAIVNLIPFGASTYVLGYTKHTAYCILLMWLGGWTALSSASVSGWRVLLRVSPLLLLVLTAIHGQARSWTILSLLMVAAFLMLRGLEEGSLASGMRNVALAAVLGGIALAFVSRASFGGAFTGIMERFGESTRSGQYLDFFSVVPASDLLLGRGPLGSWYWFGVGDYQFFDNGFLWMLFIGGVPTLVAYVILMLVPAFRAFRMTLRGPDAAAVVMVLFWTLALAGLSTYTLPSVAVGGFVVSLCVGRCHLLVAERIYRRNLALRTVQVRTTSPRPHLARPLAESAR